jgi:hypothetical protein
MKARSVDRRYDRARPPLLGAAAERDGQSEADHRPQQEEGRRMCAVSGVIDVDLNTPERQMEA